jgi:hypothetical protein
MKTKKKSPTFGRTVMDPKPKNHDDKNRVDFRGSFDFTPPRPKFFLDTRRVRQRNYPFIQFHGRRVQQRP